MTPELTIEVVGLPAPQGSKRAMTIAGRARLIDASSDTGKARTAEWRSTVAGTARLAILQRPGWEPLDGPLFAEIEFRFPMPTSRRKRVRAAGIGWHSVKPDKDKTLRATFDALKTAGAITDDARICLITVAAYEVVDWTGAIIRLGHAPALMDGAA